MYNYYILLLGIVKINVNNKYVLEMFESFFNDIVFCVLWIL